jgi:phenylpropionate dioxygenase-like ring-hydroxylating dioxygenase large terminal subunit
MPYSWQILVEKNLCDPAHVNFAHHSFMGGANHNQENQVLDIKVTKENSQGFRAQKDPYPSRGTYDVKFQPKLLVSLFYSIASDNDSFLGLGQYCIPIAPKNCRIIANFPFHLHIKPAMYAMRHTPRWITHFSQNVVMYSDVVFLASQDEKLSLTNQEPNYYMPAKCDSMVQAFRKWLTAFGGDGPEWLVGDSCGQMPWRAIWLDSTNECTSSRRPRCLVGALLTTLGYMLFMSRCS